MKNKLFALLIAALFVLPTFGANNGNFRPKLIVGIAVDQMRWDYLMRYNVKQKDNKAAYENSKKLLELQPDDAEIKKVVEALEKAAN